MEAGGHRPLRRHPRRTRCPGGETQRVGVVSRLEMQEPDILLADETPASLASEKHPSRSMGLLRDLSHET